MYSQTDVWFIVRFIDYVFIPSFLYTSDPDDEETIIMTKSEIYGTRTHHSNDASAPL